MKKLSLNGAWTLDIPDSNFRSVPASVPGSVYHDLLTAKLIPDPFYRDNENEALKLMEHDFVYSRTFEVSAEMLSGDAVLLHCDGLDTLAELSVNGKPAGRADNMHRTWEFDVKSLLKEGENSISVRFGSPTRYIRQAYEQSRADGSPDAMKGFPLLRKAHCMFGWDWGPRLPDAGIWRDISIISIDKARIRDVYIEQQHTTIGGVLLGVHTHTKKYDKDARLTLRISVKSPDGDVVTREIPEGKEEDEIFDKIIEIENPRLWWVAGYGEQPLYTVSVTLLCEGIELDRWEKRIGLRTLTICREKDEWGESFCHVINGVKIFAMGSDYIPEDNLLPRVDPERTRRLLEDARAANMNLIRVWGGGYYPDDYFYDICDELGLMVWQDLMFACAVYNLTDEFEKNITAEFVDNIRRIRSHPSLALWCGNNENESQVERWASTPKHWADYIKMYEYIIPHVLKREDPQTFYWPSSPSSGGSFDEPSAPDRGDVHYWAVWHGLKPFTDYRNYFFRYVSEFGFQSFPCMETIDTFALPEEKNVFSYVMEKHQRNSSANGIIASYLSQTYLYPSSFDLFVYASQLLQAQAIQYGVEHWRRNRGRCMGAVIWQLNDCWPVVSWSSIDYYGRWKALHYFAKRFFAGVLISCHEEGVISQNTNVNAEPFELKKTARLNVSNETTEQFEGEVRWSLRRPDASIIEEGSLDVSVPALDTVWLPKQDFGERDTYGCYYAYELRNKDGGVVGEGTVLFCAPKHFKFDDPELSARIEDGEVVVRAEKYARCVEIMCGADVLLRDNFFDMNAGERRIKILRGKADHVNVRSVYDIR